MKKKLFKKILIAIPLLFSLSSCGMKYQKAITLDEGRSLLNGANSTIENFDPYSRTSYSFSMKKEKMSGRIEDNWVTSYDHIEGTYAYNASLTTNPWSSYHLECTRKLLKEGSEEDIKDYSLRKRAANIYEILVDEIYEDYAGQYPFLENYFQDYPDDFYKTISQQITSLLIEELRNVGNPNRENDLFHYTCLSRGSNDLVLIVQSWDFSSIGDILEFTGAFPFDSESSEYTPDPCELASSINFIEVHYEGGYLVTLITGYDQRVDDDMKEQGLEKKAKNIANSYQVTFTF